MIEFLWFIVVLCGLGIMLYGYFVFIAMPAAGFVLFIIGLAIIGSGASGKNRYLKKIKSQGELGIKRKKSKRLNHDTQKADEVPENASFLVRIINTLLLVTNILLVSYFSPDFKELLGDKVGYFISFIVNCTIALFITGLIYNFLKTSTALLLFLLSTWATVYFIATSGIIH